MINTTTVPPLGVALSGRERYRCHDANLIDLALNRTQGNIIVTESYFQTESTQKLSSTMNYDAYDTSQSSLYTGPDDPAVTINRGEYCFFWFVFLFLVVLSQERYQLGRQAIYRIHLAFASFSEICNFGKLSLKF